jgi:hypothetical protein
MFYSTAGTTDPHEIVVELDTLTFVIFIRIAKCFGIYYCGENNLYATIK